MVNLSLLDSAIEARGIKLVKLAEKTGLTYQGLKYKLDGRREFKVSEADRIANALSLSDEERDAIFFNRSVDLNETD
ncbi:MAG: helix-turn-helix transcriptional regulator [Eubacteriales bacterium]|nr:helix-turn-helix transcriptional regulator [Eubacteriales bacterium]